MTIRTAAAAGLLLFALPVIAATPDYRTPGKDWGRGPVRWLMSDEEEKEFRRIKTDPERAAFVKAFWEKRDPTPGTPQNEFEEIFWKRVQEAERPFRSLVDPGWMTDMGRVFILLGPPAKTGEDARKRNIWNYEPNEVTGIKEAMVFTFAQGTTGKLLLERKLLETYVAAHPETRGIGWQIPQPVITEAAGVPGAGSAPAEDQSPESKRQIAVLEPILAAGKGPTGVPFEPAFDFYAAADGTTLAVITLQVPRQAAHGGSETALLPFARLLPQGEGKPLNLTGELAFVAAPVLEGPADSFIYQARRNLPPGTYTLGIAIEDKAVQGNMGTLVRPLAVPDYRAKELSMSSVSLLSKFSQPEAFEMEEGGGAGVYTMGSFHLVPRAVPELAPADSLAFYYQVYNPAPDPTTNRPNLEATYTFYEKDPAAGWKPYRKPVVKRQGQVELFEIAIKDLLRPNHQLPADFRLEIKVADKAANKELRGEIQFTVR